MIQVGTWRQDSHMAHTEILMFTKLCTGTSNYISPRSYAYTTSTRNASQMGNLTGVVGILQAFTGRGRI